jgi:phosphoribosyl-dephospho-CoA transferase
MLPELTTHTLLRIAGAGALTVDSEPPAWVGQSLQRAPWVVVRRAQVRDAMIPVGVRGELRQQRFACWVSRAAVLERVTPQALVSSGAWKRSDRCATIPALAALESVEKVMREHDLAGVWGPTGSVGFELACGCATATAASDLDVAVELLPPLLSEVTQALHADLSALPVRVDVLLELPQGGVALSEYVRMPGSCVLRTPEGPRLVSGP